MDKNIINILKSIDSILRSSTIEEGNYTEIIIQKMVIFILIILMLITLFQNIIY